MKAILLPVLAAFGLCLCGCCSKDKACGDKCASDKAACSSCCSDKPADACCKADMAKK